MSHPDPLGPVVVTAREIYDQLVRLTTAVGDLASQLGQVVTSQAELKAEVKGDFADHETRLRSLERGRWPLPALAVLISAAGFLLAFLDRS